MIQASGDEHMDLMKEKVRSQCERAIELSKEAITAGYIDVKSVIKPILDSISHGWGWKVRVELEREFNIIDSPTETRANGIRD